MKSIYKVSFLILLLFTSFGCQSNKDEGCRNSICTAIFVMINVTIEDENGDPVVLDDFEIINLENNSAIDLNMSQFEIDQNAANGIYTIMTDLAMDQNEVLNLQFIGFLNSQEVLRRDYVIEKDCCHIQLVSGNTEVIL